MVVERQYLRWYECHKKAVKFVKNTATRTIHELVSGVGVSEYHGPFKPAMTYK